jgi:CheY-like chemotaxis protein
VPASETILVVEDGEAVRRLVCDMLTQIGYEVLEARDARDALKLWERNRDDIALVLTDVLMPHMSGGEMALKMAEIAPSTRVLFMSGYTGDDILHEFDGVDELFLQKPFTSMALQEKVRQVLEGPWNGLHARRRTSAP